MCGFLALIDTPWQDAVDAAVKVLERRGPDATETWRDAHAALGHTRLSIIDLAGGGQPMAIEGGRYVIAYNGEVYNFAELRSELEASGKRFRGHSDTEVILASLERWGVTAAVQRFVGIGPSIQAAFEAIR